MELPHDLGDGLALRLYETADSGPLLALIEASREHLGPWHAFVHTATLESTAEWIAQVRREHAENVSAQVAIVRGEEIVGNVGFKPVDWENRVSELGYWLAPSEQGRGTMTRAVRAMLDHGFGVWHLGRVEIYCAVQNARSRAIPERLGFTHEGTHRHAERVAGRVHDLAVYGLLSEEWEAGSAGGS